MERLFWRVFRNDLLRTLILSFHTPGYRRWREWENGNVAAANGHLGLLQTRSDAMWFTQRAMDEAATNGHLEVLKWLHENRTEGCTSKAVLGAASQGHLHVLQWLHANTNVYCEQALAKAAVAGHLAVLRWMESEGYSDGKQHRVYPTRACLLEESVARASRGVVQFLLRRRPPSMTRLENAFVRAAGCGRLELVEYLHGLLPKRALSSVRRTLLRRQLGTVDILRFMLDKGILSKEDLRSLTTYHLDTMVWQCTECGKPVAMEVLEQAARRGNLDTFEWAFTQVRHQLSAVDLHRAGECAIQGGSLPILERVQCQADVKHLFLAVWMGDKEIFDWLLPQCSELSEFAKDELICRAARFNAPWLAELDCQLQFPRSGRAVQIAAAHCHVEALHYLKRHPDRFPWKVHGMGAPSTPGLARCLIDQFGMLPSVSDLTEAAGSGNIEVLRVLWQAIEHDAELRRVSEFCLSNQPDGVARRGFLDVLQWMEATVFAPSTLYTFPPIAAAAALHGELTVMQWACEHLGQTVGHYGHLPVEAKRWLNEHPQYWEEKQPTRTPCVSCSTLEVENL